MWAVESSLSLVYEEAAEEGRGRWTLTCELNSCGLLSIVFLDYIWRVVRVLASQV